jgi:CheY-like chemotaxis protein
MQQFLRQTIFGRIKLVLELDDSAPAMEGDLPQVRQILMNLVSNASDAIGDEAGTITISTGHCECDSGYLLRCLFHDEPRPGPYVYLKVKDTGIGMDEAVRRRIFEPFFTTKISGHGLGLASVQGIIRGHRGALHLESGKGFGSTFTAYFPASSKAAQTPQPAPVEASTLARTGAGLVVDDEVAVVRLAGRMLQKLGFETIPASGGREALELFRADPDRVRFVLLDMTMPNMSGREVFLEMRRIRPDVPIILSSGYGRDDVVALFKSENPSGFIQKPYQTSDLDRAIRHALGAS